jgi:hypothetical protein
MAEAQTPFPRNKKLDRLGFIMGELDGRRLKANVVSSSGVCGDVDNEGELIPYISFDAMRARLDALGLAYIMYNTTNSRPDHEKFRIILPYAVPVPPEKHEAAWDAANKKLGGVLDPATRKLAQIAIAPAHWHGDSHGKAFPADGCDRFASADGLPILSAIEIDCLSVDPSIPTAVSARAAERPSSENKNHASVSPAPPIPVHNFSPRFIALALNWDTSAYLAPWMRRIKDTHPSTGRLHAFLCAVIRHAHGKGFSVDVPLLGALGGMFEREILERAPPPPHELARVASNAMREVLNPSNPLTVKDE